MKERNENLENTVARKKDVYARNKLLRNFLAMMLYFYTGLDKKSMSELPFAKEIVGSPSFNNKYTWFMYTMWNTFLPYLFGRSALLTYDEINKQYEADEASIWNKLGSWAFSAVKIIPAFIYNVLKLPAIIFGTLVKTMLEGSLELYKFAAQPKNDPWMRGAAGFAAAVLSVVLTIPATIGFAVTGLIHPPRMFKFLEKLTKKLSEGLSPNKEESKKNSQDQDNDRTSTVSIDSEFSVSDFSGRPITPTTQDSLNDDETVESDNHFHEILQSEWEWGNDRESYGGSYGKMLKNEMPPNNSNSNKRSETNRVERFSDNQSNISTPNQLLKTTSNLISPTTIDSNSEDDQKHMDYDTSSHRNLR